MLSVLCLVLQSLPTRSNIKYVLLNPGLVLTSFAGQYDENMLNQLVVMKKIAQPIEKGIAPIINLLDNPPRKTISA